MTQLIFTTNVLRIHCRKIQYILLDTFFLPPNTDEHFAFEVLRNLPDTDAEILRAWLRLPPDTVASFSLTLFRDPPEIEDPSPTAAFFFPPEMVEPNPLHLAAPRRIILTASKKKT